MANSVRWRTTRATALLALVLVVFEFSSSALAATSTSRAIPSCKSATGLVCLTNQAGGRVSTVRRGTHVEVTLRGAQLDWSSARQLAPTILHLIGSPIRVAGESRTTFLAVRDGRTVLQATAAAKCAPGTVCPQFVLLWRATIVVVH